MTQLIHERETYESLGACFEVYKEKGCGFLEGVYQECLEIELPLSYKGRKLKKRYEADFVCYEKVLVEIKAVGKLSDSCFDFSMFSVCSVGNL